MQREPDKSNPSLWSSSKEREAQDEKVGQHSSAARLQEAGGWVNYAGVHGNSDSIY